MMTGKKAYFWITPGLLILSACQMPVRPNKTPVAPAVKSPAVISPVSIATVQETTPVSADDAAANSAALEAPLDAPIASSINTQTGAVVFERLRKNFSGPICNNSTAISQWKKRYANNPKSFSNHLGEILPLLDYVSLEVERRKLPAEFALIPIIESWYQPHAVGVGGPAGLWQMIGSTAKNHGIKIQSGYDGRYSVVDSTDAALSYLGTLQKMFNDWQRAVMGYNAGEFRVLRAIRNSGNNSEGKDHWPHGLSPITYAYIAKIQALSCLISHAEENNLSLPNAREFTPLLAILVDENAGSLDTIAKRYQTDADKLKRNNPAYKQGRIANHAPRRILMPANVTNTAFSGAAIGSAQAPAVTDALMITTSIDEPHSGSHEVKNGESLWSIAKRYGLSIQSLRKINGLGRNPVLRVGQSLKLLP